MNKTQKSQLPISYQTLNKSETDNFRHQVIMKSSQNLSSEKSSIKNTSNIYSQGYQQKSIFIKKTSIDRTISVYQWRYKTCYPIIKPIQLKIKSFTGTLQTQKFRSNNNSTYEVWNLDQNLLQVVVTIQKIQWKLSQIDKLPLNQVIYLFKEALVSFQCLIDIFGLFQPTQNMIAVNSLNQWRFWISEDFTSNSKKQAQLTQQQFLMKLITIVQSKLIMSKTGSKLFSELKNLSSKQLKFLNVLNITKKYIEVNKIMVSKKVYVSQIGNSRTLLGSKNGIQVKHQQEKQSQLLNKTCTYQKNKAYDSTSKLGMKINTSIQSLHYTKNNPKDIKESQKTNLQFMNQKGLYSNSSLLIGKNITPRNHNQNNFTQNNPARFEQSKNLKQSLTGGIRQRSKSPIYIKMNNNQIKQTYQNNYSSNVSAKAPLKISELYISDLTKNNIEKRASFMLQKKQSEKEPQKFKTDEKTYKYNPIIVKTVDQNNESPRNTISYTLRAQQAKHLDLSPKRLFSPMPSAKKQIKLIKKEKQTVFDLLKYKESKKNEKSLKSKSDLETKSAQNYANKKNIFKVNVEKPENKQAYSQSPTKSHKLILKQNSINFDYFAQFQKKKEGPNTARSKNQNLINRQVNRQRKLSQQIPKIRSLDQLAKKDKKMCQSTVLTAAQQQKQKKINYNNLKRNDIQNQSRYIHLNSGFGSTFKQINPTFHSNHEIYNQKAKEKKKSHKYQQNQCDLNFQLNLNSNIQRKKTVFAIIQEQTDRKYSQDKPDQQNQSYSPFYQSQYTKPQIKISNVNNQTAETLNHFKGSENDNSINSRSKNQKNLTPQNSDYSQEKKQIYANSKGLIGESNLSVFSCRTQQPIKKKKNNATQKKNNQKPMATSQDFVKNESSSENTSEQFLKSNNWNKKISGLFSDVASIKVLRQSGHFGDQTDFFQKDYLKDVKLQKLGKLGKELKGSIISDDDNGFLNVPYNKPQQNYKSISLIGEVKQDPYEYEPSVMQHSTSMIYQSKHNKQMDHSFVQLQKSMRQCQSQQFQEQDQKQQFQNKKEQIIQTRNRRATQFSNGGFNFQSQLYNIRQAHKY